MKIQFFYVYILFSRKDQKLYIGYTEDLKARLGEHFRGRVVATKNRKPLTLIHYEAASDAAKHSLTRRTLKPGKSF